MTLAILACVVVVAVVGVQAQSSSCQLQAGWNTYDAGVACLMSIPFSEEVRTTTIDTLRKSISVFAFTEMAANPPPQSAGLTIKATDLYAGLDAIASNSYSSDIAFQNDLVFLYAQLCDAHSLYFRPQNYAVLTFWQPFTLVSTGGGSQILVAPYFAPGVEAAFQSVAGINVTQYGGATVQMINGQPAATYLTTFADNYVGLSKDLATRFNVALTRFDPTPGVLTITAGAFQKRRGLYFKFPLQDELNVQYTLVLGDGSQVTMTFPWLVQSNLAFPNQQAWLNSYYQQFDEQTGLAVGLLDRQEAQRAAAEETGSSVMPHLRTNKAALFGGDDTYTVTDDSLSRPEDNGFVLLFNTYNLTFWQHPDQITLVLFLETFEPQNLTSYINGLQTGFAMGQKLGLTRLILDFTDNGGGDICFGIAMLQMMFDNAMSGNDMGNSPTDMPATDFTLQLAQLAVAQNNSNTIWSASSYMTYPGSYDWANTNVSWMIPPIARPRGSETLDYSQVLDLSAAACGPGYGVTPLQNPFPADQTLIVTRGFCGSTCALVSGHTHLFHNVQTVTLGGLAAQPDQQAWSFPGLQVVDHPDFYLMWQSLGLNITYTPTPNPSELCPRQLKTTAGYRYCIREIYPPRSDFTVPLEYTFEPSDFHIYFDDTNVFQADRIWLQVTEFFPNNPPKDQ